MFYANLWGPQDEEMFIDMSIRRSEIAQEKPTFKAWMNARISWGKPTLIVAAGITAISIVSMIVKHI